MICDAKWQQDKNHPFTRRRYCESYIFNYPGQQILKDVFYSPQEITNYLIKQANYLGYYQGQIFQKKSIIKDGSTHYIYSCNRKSCDAVLQYRKKRGVLVLEKFRNQHIHKIRLTRKKAKTFQIKQYLMDLPAEDNVQFHLQAVKQKFNLNKQQAKYIKSKLFWRCQTQQELLQRLTQKNVTFRRHLQEDKTTILLICTETMKSNYKKYGDLLCFDITYKLLKKRRKQAKHLGVGFFVGQDQNTRIVLYGMCTISHQTTDNFIKLFSFFFEIMEQRMPKTILTDDQRTLGTALQKIKQQKGYQYNHMLDWYHKIQAMKRNIKRQFNKDMLFPLICKILKQPSKQIYIDILFQIATFLKKQQIMLDFIKDQHKYCLSQVPSSFFGFGVSSTRAQSMNNLIKRSVSHQTNLGKLVFFVMRVQQRLLNNMKVLNQINMDLLVNIKDPQILQLAKNMQHLAFDQIRQYYQASRQLQLIEIDEISYQIPYQKYDRPYKFLLKFDIERKCWRCQCHAIYKTGLPCSHLIKVIKKHKGSLIYYVNPRWIHFKKDSDHKKISRPPIAKNRKRI